MANIENNLGNIIVLSKAKYQELVNNNQLVLGNLYYIKDDLDQTPTAGSDNLVTSGGVAAALQDAINSLDVSDVAVNGQFVYSVSETDGKITVSRRAIQDSDGVVLKTGDQTISGIKTFSNKPVFNDGATVNGDMSVSGDLYVTGTQHIVDVETLESQSNLFVANSNNSNLSALGGAGFIARVGDSQDPSKAYAVAYYDVTDDSVKLGEGTYSKSEYVVTNSQFTIDNTTYTIGTLSDGNGIINPGNIEVTNFIFELNDVTYEIHRNNDGTYKSVVSQSFTLTDGQAIATRTNLVNDNIPQWDETNSTLIDSGKKVSDFLESVKTIQIASSQVYNAGEDSYTTAKFIRFIPTQEQALILANENYQIIKLDLRALGDNAPAPYVWVKRNTKVTINGLTAYQFSCGGEQFWYDNYQTDIAIKNIGNGALVYVPQLILDQNLTPYGVADITLLNISIPDLYDNLGKIPTNIENGMGKYSLQQKYTNTLDEHAKGGTAVGNGSIALGIGDTYPITIEFNAFVDTNTLFDVTETVNPNWQNMALKIVPEISSNPILYYQILEVDETNNRITVSGQVAYLGSAYVETQISAGKASSVKGEYSQSFAEAASVEGIISKATKLATASHTEGYNNLTNQAYAHNEGRNNIASGIAVHIEGEYNTSFHNAAHVGGSHNQSTRDNQTVIGEYANLTRSDTLLNVGVGNADNDRKSGLQVLKDGRVKILTGPISADDAVTKGYADNNYGPLHEDRKVVYATTSTETSSGSGKYTQTAVAYSAGLNNGCIVQRDGQQILVPDEPTQNNHATSKKYVDAKTIVVAVNQITGTGNDTYTTAQYIRFTPTADQATILADENVQNIKLDLTNLGDSVPAPYVWLRRNTTVQIANNLAYQFSCGGEQFWYDNYQTDIAIKDIGNAALVYVPNLLSADITFLSISIPTLYETLGKIPTNLKNAEGAGSIKLDGNTVIGLNSTALGHNNTVQPDRALATGGGNVIRYDPNHPGTLNGYMGFASGQNNYVSGWAAAAIGEQLEAKYGGQLVVGVANENKSDNLLEVGNGEVNFMSTPKPLWQDVLSNPIYYRHIDGTKYSKITQYTITEEQYNALGPLDVYIFDPSSRSNAFEVSKDGTARAYGVIMTPNDLTTKSYVDAKTIVVTANQIAGSGNDVYTTAPYIRFLTTDTQAAILANEDVQVIKLDLTALGDSAPAPYIWLRRNTQVTIQGHIAYQFSCGGEQFWYDNYQTDIAIKNIGNGALVYVPDFSIADITLLNISIPELYESVGNKQDKLTFDNTPTAGSTNPVTSEGIKTAIDNAIVAVYKPAGTASVATLNSLTKSASMNGYVYDMTDSGTLTNYDGTTETVKAKDNVCFLWHNGSWKWDNFGEVVDLSGYVQKTTEIAGLQIQNGISASSLLNELFTVNTVTVDEE